MREYRIDVRVVSCDADGKNVLWQIIKAAKKPVGRLIGAVGTAEELDAKIMATGRLTNGAGKSAT
jgi:hypothetical protein